MQWHALPWQNHAEGYRIEIGEGWTQGRTLYGGLVGALAAALVRQVTPRAVRAMHCSFIGPLSPGVVEGRAHIKREGKNVSFVEVQLEQQGKIGSHFMFVCSDGRDSRAKVAAPPAPSWNDPESYRPLPRFPGAPEFTQNVDFRFTEGGLPFQGGDDARFGAYVRMREAPEVSSTEWQLAMLDAFPAPTLALLDRPAPASSVNWSAQFIAPSSLAKGHGYHMFRYETVATSAGFSTVMGHLWDPEGNYVAFTEQSALVFD